MGYRSDVSIRCETKAFHKLMSVCRENKFFPEEIYKSEGAGTYTVKWEWVKWYDSYPEVAAVMNALAEFDRLHNEDAKDSDGLGYSFIRLGEETDDIETQTNDYDIEFYVTRDIDTPDTTLLSISEKRNYCF